MTTTLLNVTCVNKDEKWNITHIWGKWWTHTYVNAIYNIENDLYAYKVNNRTNIVVLKDPIEWKFLRSENTNPEDNLDNLNWCHIYGK